MTLHAVQRGNNRSAAFHDTQDYLCYLRLLEAAARRYETRVHAYVLMTNHVHLLLTSNLLNGISRTLQYVASRYVQAANERYGRTGTLWESRYRSTPVDSERYCLACYRYIELNPVRAGIVKSPEDYRWSSYRVNSTARWSSLVSPHPTFLALSETPAGCAAQYRLLVREALPDDVLQDIRSSLRRGVPAGDEAFREKIEASLKRRIGTGKRGRPPKNGS